MRRHIIILILAVTTDVFGLLALHFYHKAHDLQEEVAILHAKHSRMSPH